MTTLVVSLLRNGDLAMITPVISHLHSQGYRVDVLTFEENRRFFSLLPHVNMFHTIDRLKIQYQISSVACQSMASLSDLSNLLSDLRDLGFDQVINLTSSRFSSWICSAIDNGKTVGLRVNEAGEHVITAQWLQYLNDFAGDPDCLHWSDIFQLAVGIEKPHRTFFLKEQWVCEESKVRDRTAISQQTFSSGAEAKSEVGQFAQSTDRRDVVAVQAFSSDPKKNWSMSKWAQWVFELRSWWPQIHFVFLCAPGEEDLFNELFLNLQSMWERNPVLCEGAERLPEKQSNQAIGGKQAGMKRSSKVSVLTGEAMETFDDQALSDPDQGMEGNHEKEPSLKAHGIGNLSIEIEGCSFEKAYSLLKTSDLLVSVDTVIKHMGVAATVPIIELALGSARPAETGSYSEGSWIITPSRMPCYPCAHTNACSQSIPYKCRSTISAEVLARLTEVRLGLRSLSSLADSKIDVSLKIVTRDNKGRHRLRDVRLEKQSMDQKSLNG